jgi:DNA invertase Pin-like site-specific DNA recombinase
MNSSDNPPAIRVAGYIRGSTDEQVNTLDAQRAQIAAYCEFKGLHLVECFVDQGESGTTPFFERPKAAEMVARMTELDATGIVITKLDRGFRNALDCLFTIEQFKRQGLGLHLLDIHLDPTSPVGELLITMMAGIAQFENRRRSERQKAAFAVLRAQGKRCGAVPYGWTLGLGDLLVSKDEEQETLRRIVAWSEDDGLGPSTIAGLLNRKNIPTKNGGKKWFPATVESVLKHARLAPEPQPQTPAVAA